MYKLEDTKNILGEFFATIGLREDKNFPGVVKEVENFFLFY